MAIFAAVLWRGGMVWVGKEAGTLLPRVRFEPISVIQLLASQIAVSATSLAHDWHSQANINIDVSLIRFPSFQGCVSPKLIRVFISVFIAKCANYIAAVVFFYFVDSQSQQCATWI